MHVGATTCMFKGDCAYVAIGVQIQDRILIEILGFDNIPPTELDVQSICILEVLNFHGLYPR